MIVGKTITIPNTKAETDGRKSLNLQNNKLNRRDDSVCLKSTDGGVVDTVLLTSNEEGKKIAQIRMRSIRIPEIGDKICSRISQKGVIGLMLNQEDMPFTQSGIVPDLCINPHSMPSQIFGLRL